MTSGILFEPREILLVNIKFPGRPNKLRPVLVISKFSTSNSAGTFVCLPITSKLSDDPLAIRIHDSDVEEKLQRPSQVLCHYFFTPLKKKQIKRLSRVTPQFYQKVVQKIRQDVLDVEMAIPNSNL